MTLTRRLRLVVVAAAAFVAASSIAYAAIPDAGGVIHTCYTKSSGAWRVIDTGLGQTCKANELPLDVYSKGGADALFLDQTEANGLYLGKTEKAADSDKLDGQDSSAFLGSSATAADSEKLGGVRARAYVLGQGFLLNDAVIFGDGGTHRFGCCDAVDLTPRTDFAASCNTAGGTTLTVSSAVSFRWWWDETSGEATPVAGGFEAEFTLGGGAERHSLRALMINFGTTTNLDLDTWIGSTCLLAWTLHKAPNDSPGP